MGAVSRPRTNPCKPAEGLYLVLLTIVREVSLTNNMAKRRGESSVVSLRSWYGLHGLGPTRAS